MVHLFRTVRGTFHFRFRLVLIKLYIFVQQKHGLFERHNSFQNENNRKTAHSLAPRPLNFKLQQKF